jgi:hypothetical protein
MKTQKQPTAAAATTPTIYDMAPSQNWSRAMPPGPDIHVKITKEYAKHVARDAFFWTWPLINIYNRRLRAEKLTELSYAGPVPAAPLNRIVMLTDYVAPDERIVACPNQDVVYGTGSVGLDESPVVIQVPDFGNRFWVYQSTFEAIASFRSARCMARLLVFICLPVRTGMERYPQESLKSLGQ